jgi:putative spermidine/putrescine transport system substrate-binding protein
MTLFMKDCAAIASEALSRRRMLKAGIAATAVSASGLAPAFGQGRVKELVLCNWGGEPAKAYKQHFGTPFKAETGIELTVDGSGPLVGKIRAMVDAKNTAWDLCDTDVYRAIALGQAGYLEKVDYSIVDRSKVRPDWAVDHGIAGYAWSYVRAWRKDVFGAEGPKSWADVWDTKRYPGKRAFYKAFQCASEAALLADGVQPANLYPLDIARATRKLKELGNDLVLYSSFAESQRAFAAGEFAFGMGLHTRISLAEADSNGKLGFDFRDSLYCNGAWIIPKGNPAGPQLASKLIAITQRPEVQIALFKHVRSGPVNPAALAMIPPELKRYNPSDADNLKVAIVRNEAWYAANAETADRQFREAMG